MSSPPSLHPRHWRGWLSVAFIRCIAYTPPRVSGVLSQPLAVLLRLLLARRRRIAQENLRRCFPELTANQRRRLLKAHFQSLALTLFESAWVWAGRPLETILRVEYHGLAHLQRPADQGLLIVSGHMTSMDLGGCLLCQKLPLSGVYRPLRSPVLEWYHTRGRLRYARSMLSKYDVTAMLRHLRAGGALWYAPDQDFGHQRSLFISFFGQPCATLKATWLLAKRGKAKVVTMFPRRLGAGHYRIDIQPPLAVTHNPEDLLTQINQRIEAAVRAAPEQYWWVHRRFKTQPKSTTQTTPGGHLSADHDR